MAVHVYLMRHGPTDMNEAGIIQGRLDASLTAEGEEVVLRHGRYLAALALGPFRILCSPLKRTRDTAAILARELAAPVDFEEALTEIGRGELEGLSKKALPPALDAAYRGFVADPWNVRPPGGESFADVEARLRAAAPRILGLLDAASPLAVVSHGTVAKILATILCGLDRAVVDRVPAKHHLLYHVSGDGAGALSLEILDGRAGYAPLDWRALPDGAVPDA